jgi:hypothetical protein
MGYALERQSMGDPLGENNNVKPEPCEPKNVDGSCLSRARNGYVCFL